MKIPRLLLFTLALSVAFANGEETPTVEIFGGYSYAYADFNRMEQMNNKLNGWNTSFASNVNHWMGAVADFSGHGHRRRPRSQPDQAFCLANQADYLLTHLFRRTQNNLRFSSGILVRF